MSDKPAKLYFMCGKMAAGKSTYAKDLARAKNAVLIVQDEFLGTLYPGEIRDIPDFVKYSARLRQALSGHIRHLLSQGVSVALDFPGNTRIQRQWFRELFEGANVEHELHFIDTPDDLCKRQLRQRSACLPAPPGPRTPSSMRSRRIFNRPLTMKSSTSFVMSGPDHALSLGVGAEWALSSSWEGVHDAK